MSKHTSKPVGLWLAAIGAKGGRKKTKAQTEARKANAKKARETRAKKLLPPPTHKESHQ